MRISSHSFEVLSSAGSTTTVAADETLFAQGDQADALFLVVAGKISVSLSGSDEADGLAEEVGPGEVAGAIEILTGGKRRSTARALSSATVVRVEKAVVDRLASEQPALMEPIRDAAMQRLRSNLLASILHRKQGLNLAQVEAIETLGQWVKLSKGEALFEQGDVSDGVYFLVSGLLGVLVRAADGSTKLANQIQHGELVGEMAVLSDFPRSATIYATRESELLFFTNAEFMRILDQYPRFMLAIARTNINRLRATSQGAMSTSTSVIALVPGSADVPIAEFTRRLTESIGGSPDVLAMDRTTLQELLGVTDDSDVARAIMLDSRMPGWLSGQEGHARFILLQADWNDERWTQCCIKHADQAITVALADGDPALSELESRYVYAPQKIGEVRKRLVLIQPDDRERPRGTSRWLTNRRIEMHHHVRLGNRSDFDRLGRFLTGTAICLALGGGGARGYAHVGAIRAFAEEGLPIDIVGGTSMGAIVGGAFALGVSYDALRHVSTGALVRDFTLPLLAFTSGKAIANILKNSFGDAEIEDMWIPYFCVSSNISRAERAVHRSGPLWRKVRASASVQGVFPPVVMDGELHVDGAPFANLPADVMRSICEGTIIAIDVTPPVDLLSHVDIGDEVSGWKILWQKWFRGKSGFRCTDLGTIVQRSGEAVATANQKATIERISDYYLRMPVENYDMFGFSELDKLEVIGYDHAREKIAEWVKDGRWTRLMANVPTAAVTAGS